MWRTEGGALSAEIMVMLHCVSRSFRHQVATDCSQVFLKAMESNVTFDYGGILINGSQSTKILKKKILAYCQQKEAYIDDTSHMKSLLSWPLTVPGIADGPKLDHEPSPLAVGSGAGNYPLQMCVDPAEGEPHKPQR